MPTKEHSWPVHPKIYEINTWQWLTNLTDIYGHDIKLDSIPIELIDRELTLFDVVWLMGVWERSPISREIAMNHEGLQEEYRKALKYYNTQDVVGSPYSVYYYHVSSQLGGFDALKSFRADLAAHELLLILDYVPNHVSIDHLWTLEKSDVFIKGTLEELMTKPYDFFSVGDIVYAHGRDPNFPAWTDTVQINAFSSEARSKAINTLLSIAKYCDGVRCDMAMLMTNSVFSRTWEEKAGPALEKEFWEEIIVAVKNKFPNFKFIAEVYWDMEWELMQQGFDYCYDKKLYDRMLHENAETIRAHLHASWDYQQKLIRFIENHDEQRAIIAFGKEKSKAAAILALTLPGARLIYEGQMKGYKIKLPVQLGRRQSEEEDQGILEFYLQLLNSLPEKKMGEGIWSMCEVDPTGDLSNTNLISFVWQFKENYLLIVVNFSPYLAKGNVRIENIDYGSTKWNFTDLLTQNGFVYEGDHLDAHGLFVELPAWNGHIFDLRKID